MTNQQLYLAIGIPSILVILSWISNFRFDAKFDKINDRIDRMAEQHHADMMTLQRDIVGLHDRVAKVEKA